MTVMVAARVPEVAPTRETDVLRAMAARIDPQDSGAFNNLGVLFFSKGRHADAVDAFLRALVVDPRMRTAARNLEIAAAKPGACDDRLAALDARVQADIHDMGALRERARLYRLIGRIDDAIRQLETLIAEDPDDALALFERGLIEQRAGDLRRAQRWFERAANAADHTSADAALARLHLAEVLYQRGQNEQALSCLDALLHLQPELPDAHLLQGFVLGDLGRHEAARTATQRAAQLNPALRSLQVDLSLATTAHASELTSPLLVSGESEGELARYGLGLAFRQRGYFTEARREFERALSGGEAPRLAQHALAELDLIAGLSSSAQDRYEQLLAEHAEEPRYWNESGVAFHQAGALQEAAERYRRALRCDPRDAMAYNNLGVALADQQDAAAAREALARAIDLDPALVLARLNMAQWLVASGDPLASLSLLRELSQFHSTNADVWHAMGVALDALQRPVEARDAQVRAIAHRPHHAAARYALAEVLGQLGDADGAVRETQQALTLAPVRPRPRMHVGIALQRECPDAVGPLDLLAVQGGTPLRGVALDAAAVATLLPEADVQGAGVLAARGAQLLERAHAFAARGLHGEAVERYREARVGFEADAEPVRSDADGSRHAAWRESAIGEARSQCLLGHGEQALPLLRRLGAQHPQDAEVLVLFASAMRRKSAAAGAAASVSGAKDATDTARVALRRLLPQTVPSGALWHFAGDIALALPDHALALVFYRRALAQDRSRPTPRVAIAQLLRAQGDLLAAQLELSAALAVSPGWREAVLELALVHRDAQRFADARHLLVRHLSHEPTDLEALSVLAEVLMAEDRVPDARVVIARLLRHDPDHTGALWMDAALLVAQDRLREAVSRWQRLVTLGVDDHFVRRAHDALSHPAVFRAS